MSLPNSMASSPQYLRQLSYHNNCWQRKFLQTTVMLNRYIATSHFWGSVLYVLLWQCSDNGLVWFKTFKTTCLGIEKDHVLDWNTWFCQHKDSRKKVWTPYYKHPVVSRLQMVKRCIITAAKTHHFSACVFSHWTKQLRHKAAPVFIQHASTVEPKEAWRYTS